MTTLIFSACIVTACAPLLTAVAQPVEYLNNLRNPWIQAGGIGDIESVAAYGPTTASFTTGNTPVQLSSIRFEFITGKGAQNDWGSLDVSLQASSDQSGAKLRLPTASVSSARTLW